MSTNPGTAVADPLEFTITDVTGRNTLDVENVDGHRTAGDVATSMASLMELPTSTPYALRDDARARRQRRSPGRRTARRDVHDR